MPIVLCGYEAWSLTLRKEQRLRVFEIRLLRRMFGPKTDEMTVEWRTLRNEDRNDLYSSPNIIRVIKSRIIRWTGHMARMGDRRIAYRVLVGDLREGDQMEDIGLSGSVILMPVSNMYGGWHGLDCSGSG